MSSTLRIFDEARRPEKIPDDVTFGTAA